MSAKRKALIIFLLFLFTFFYRLLFISFSSTPIEYLKYLPFENDLRATNLLAGKTIFLPDAWSSYYLFLAGLYKIFLFLGIYEQKIFSLVIINILLGSLSVVIFYLIARKILSPFFSLISSLILAIYLPLVHLNALNMSENLYVFTLVFLLLLLLEKEREITNFLIGLFLGISLSIRPILYPFVPFLIIWIFNQEKSRKKALLRIIQVTIVTSFIILSINIINLLVSGGKNFGFGGNGGVNFAIAQCDLKKLTYKYNSDSFTFKPPAHWSSKKLEITTNVPFASQGYYYQMGWRCLWKNPRQLITNLIRLKNIFFSIFYPNFIKTTLYSSYFFFWKVVSFIFFILSLLYPFVEKNGKKRQIYWLLGGLFASLLLAVYWINVGEERYLAPYFFILNLFAFASVEKLCSHKSQKTINKKNRQP